MSSIVKIKNNTGVPQSIVFKGRQIILDANEVSSFDSDIAEHFIQNRSPLVEVVPEEVNQFDLPDNQMIWVANFTGNKDLPETVNVRQWASGRWFRADIPNPIREEVPIKRECDRGMITYTAKDGSIELKNLPKALFYLAPYTRKAFPKNMADWSLKRDAVSDVPRSIVKSRPPTSFEPNKSWNLDDIRGYLRLIDPTAEVGPSELDVTTTAEKDSEALRAGESGIRAYVNAAKKVILQRVFFRVADPQYHLPSREEFTEFMTGEAPVQKSSSDAIMDMVLGSAEEVPTVKRKRGRPPGAKNKKKKSEEVVTAP